MKIDNEIYYKLYYSTLDLKIEKAKKDLEIFQLTFRNIKNILKSYKPYIEANVSTMYQILLISPSYSVRGKLAERYEFNGVLYTKEAFYSYLRNYKKNFDRINKHKEYITSLERQKISYKVYVKILKKFNLKISYEMVFRQYVLKLGYGLGNLFVARKIAKKEKINWNASNKRKAILIENNKIPFYKADKELAEKEGLEYNGVEWLRYHNKENVWIHHQMVNVTSYKFQLIKSNLTASLKYYLTELRGSEAFNAKEFPLVKN